MPWATARGLGRGYADILRRWSERQPVPPDAFVLYNELKSRGAVPLEQIRPRLPRRA
jgi:hypothetical protein